MTVRRWLWVYALTASGAACLCGTREGLGDCTCGNGAQIQNNGEGCAGSSPGCGCVCSAFGGACNGEFNPACFCGPETAALDLPSPGCTTSVTECLEDCGDGGSSIACDAGAFPRWAEQVALPDGGSVVCYCNGCACFASFTSSTTACP